MVAEISEQLFSALQPRLVSAYLSSKGWQTTQEGDAVHWSRPDYPDQLVIPLDDSVTPELVQQLASLEQRPASRVLTELKHADADILRIAPVGAGFRYVAPGTREPVVARYAEIIDSGSQNRHGADGKSGR